MSKSEVAIPTLTSDTAVDILNKTLEELELPENVQKIEEARNAIGNEMLKMMQYMFPIVMQIQVGVLKEFGYPEGRDGPIKFAQMLRTLERDDEEVARLHSLIKAYYLPPVGVLATTESLIEERHNSMNTAKEEELGLLERVDGTFNFVERWILHATSIQSFITSLYVK